jgi:hypothetical protein
MYVDLEDHLSFIALAKAWATEPGALAERDIIQRLLALRHIGLASSMSCAFRSASTTSQTGIQQGLPWSFVVACPTKHFWTLEVKTLTSPTWQRLQSTTTRLLGEPSSKRWCLTKGICKPAFWFEGDKKTRALPGRPSSMHLIENQMELRAREKRLAPTLTQESRELANWADENLPPQEPRPRARTIGNRLRSRYRQLRSIPA